MKELWVEKYRPKILKEYVVRDDAQRQQIQTWINDKAIPHLLLSGAPGVGKTTLAKVLFNELEVSGYDILEINASRENSVDTVREKINNFVQIMPFGDYKYVLLDEADYMSPNGQAALRGVMETYHTSARFIITCNYPNRIIPALHSRCQGFHMETIDKNEFTARVAEILIAEKMDPDLETLDTYVKATYPDLRKCINMVNKIAEMANLCHQQVVIVDNKIIDYKWLNYLKQVKLMKHENLYVLKQDQKNAKKYTDGYMII